MRRALIVGAMFLGVVVCSYYEFTWRPQQAYQLAQLDAQKRRADEQAAAEQRDHDEKTAAAKKFWDEKEAEEKAGRAQKHADELAAAAKKLAEDMAVAAQRRADEQAAAEKRAGEEKAAAAQKLAAEKAAADKRAAAENPRTLEEFLFAVEKHLKKRDYKNAMEFAEKAIQFAPGSAQPLYLRGLVNSGVEDTDRQFEADARYRASVKDFDAALKIDPKHAHSLAIRAMVLTGLNDFAKAKADIEEAAKLDAKLDWVYIARAQVLMAEKASFAKVQEQLNKAVQLNPKRSITFIYRALSKAQQRQWAGALQDANYAIGADPTNPDAYATRGVIRALGLNELRAAASDLDMALKLNPNHRQAANNRAQLRNLGY